MRMHFRPSPSRLVGDLEAEAQQEHGMHQFVKQVQHLTCLPDKNRMLILIQEVSRGTRAFANPAYMGELGSSAQGEWDDNLSTGMANGPVYHEGMWWSCRDAKVCCGLLGVMNCDNPNT